MPEFDSNGRLTTTPISISTVFDAVTIEMDDPFKIGSVHVVERTGEGTIIRGRVPAEYRHHNPDFNTSNPEVAEVLRRIHDGSCEVLYEEEELGYITEGELHHTHWSYLTAHPFHAHDNHLIISELVFDGRYGPATDTTPARFTFPGIVEGNVSGRYYRRHESPQAPDIIALANLTGAGWTKDIPWGAHALSAIDVLDAPKTFAVSAPTRVYHRRKDEDGAITAMARAWRNYWNALDSSYQNNPVRRTMRDHVEHAIGRMWADRPNDGSISIFYDGQRTGRTRDARDVEDWILGNMEQWVHEWGFPAMALALNNGSNRTLLESQLGDYTFCHLKEDGSVGDRLNNGGDGITQATWDAYQDTHYQSALGTIITAEAGPDAIVQSGGNYAMQGSASILNPSGTTVYAWELASGEGGSLDDAAVAAPSFTAPTLAAGTDPVVLVYRLTVTNNNASDSDQVTLQVASAVLLPGLASIPVTAGGTREHQLTHTGGIAPYTYAKVSGPAWISIDGTTGVVTATPPADTAVGDHASGYEVTDASGAVVASIISFAVQSA